ncbi:MAG TPA: hypothetical protein VMF58_13055 [Rhizomicrobium sp.]|nr:hypothetical protein [Rhizomicrobium sp.]
MSAIRVEAIYDVPTGQYFAEIYFPFESDNLLVRSGPAFASPEHAIEAVTVGLRQIVSRMD